MGLWDNPVRRRTASGPKPGDIVQTYPDGTAMIYTGIDDYGNPKYDFMDISGPSGSDRAPVYGPGGGAGVVSVDPVGYGYVKVTYSDGSSEGVAGRSPEAGQQPTYYGGDLPSGYVPIRDTTGNIVGYEQDPGYVSPFEREQFG